MRFFACLDSSTAGAIFPVSYPAASSSGGYRPGPYHKARLDIGRRAHGNLDSKNSQDVMELLLEASRRYQQTVLMITHNANLAAGADHVLNVTDGILRDLGRLENETLS